MVICFFIVLCVDFNLTLCLFVGLRGVFLWCSMIFMIFRSFFIGFVGICRMGGRSFVVVVVVVTVAIVAVNDFVIVGWSFFQVSFLNLIFGFLVVLTISFFIPLYFIFIMPILSIYSTYFFAN